MSSPTTQLGTSPVEFMSTETDDEFDSVPEPFSGKQSKIGAFLVELERTFKNQPEVFGTDRAKVIFATSHLRGKALEWALKTKPEQTDSYEHFTTALKDKFGQPDEAGTAFHQLKKLRMHGVGTAQRYRTEFTQLAAQCDLGSGPDAVVKKNKWFYRGLHDDIKDSLVHIDWDWKDDFDSFADKVIRLDQRLKSRRMSVSQRN